MNDSSADALSRREAARIVLARSIPPHASDLEASFASALRVAAGALGIQRVGLWVGNEDWSVIRSRLVYDAVTDAYTRDFEIDLSHAPAYSAALRSRRTITADDAQTDPRTRELRDYLLANDIRSMLDCPVFENGELYGVVCHEQVGAIRLWSKSDADFAASVSDMIGLYLAQHTAKKNAVALLDAHRALESAHVMESLGRMAAGVAHDFNNVLAAIGLSVERLGRGSEPGSLGARTAADVLPLVDQGTRIVRHLLTFAHRGPHPESIVELGAVVRASRAVLEPLSRDGIEIAIEVPSEPTRVRVERSQFEQVLMNLAVNARDAMLGGGHLTLRLVRDDDAAVLRVSDTGVGMDEPTTRRIFEPFFSTKPATTGSGLGLATVYGIVTDAGGTITVTSEPGAGTEFTIRLPLAR